jgi:hypothetical protein
MRLTLNRPAISDAFQKKVPTSQDVPCIIPLEHTVKPGGVGFGSDQDKEGHRGTSNVDRVRTSSSTRPSNRCSPRPSITFVPVRTCTFLVRSISFMR